jgi:hypothetical protein
MLDLLKVHEDSERIKVKNMYEKWSDDVFMPINRGIQEQLDALVSFYLSSLFRFFRVLMASIATNENSLQSFEEISRRRRNDFQEFLDTTNKKGAIFRDIIIESEYDPLRANRQAIRIRVPKLNDPMKKAQLKRVRLT